MDYTGYPDAARAPTPALQIVRGIGVPKGPSEKARAAKRARRSEIERLSRLRRNGQYGSMRDEVARLERLQADLIASRRALQPPSDTSDSDDAAAVRRDRYLRAVSEVRRLRAEQSQLQDMVHEQALLAISLQEMVEAFAEVEMVTFDEARTTWIDPLTMSDALALMRESCEIAATFDTGGPWESTGGHFMGWRDKRKLVETTSTMIHRFTKEFPGRCAQELMETSWRRFCEEGFYQKTIVNSSTSLQIHVLQVLNDNIRVVRRQTRYAAMPQKSFHTVYVMFRIQIPNGFAICFKSVSTRDVRRTLGENESWVDVFHWITFTHLDGQSTTTGCEVTFGGTLNSGVRSFALHWLIESALAVVRWETVCVAPLFILPASSEGDGDRGSSAE